MFYRRCCITVQSNKGRENPPFLKLGSNSWKTGHFRPAQMKTAPRGIRHSRQKGREGEIQKWAGNKGEFSLLLGEITRPDWMTPGFGILPSSGALSLCGGSIFISKVMNLGRRLCWQWWNSQAHTSPTTQGSLHLLPEQPTTGVSKPP